jgi:rhodanese-related sulfurtransferase
MKKYLLVTLFALLALGIFGFSKLPDAPAKETTANAATQQQAPADTKSFSDIQQKVRSGAAYLLDVRTPEEYNAGHFANATLYPLQTIEAGTLPALTKDSALYVYCRSGNRSAQATTLLKQAGYTNVIDLGGLTDVEQIGGALVKN